VGFLCGQQLAARSLLVKITNSFFFDLTDFQIHKAKPRFSQLLSKIKIPSKGKGHPSTGHEAPEVE
jgi:hypothetical protein